MDIVGCSDHSIGFERVEYIEKSFFRFDSSAALHLKTIYDFIMRNVWNDIHSGAVCAHSKKKIIFIYSWWNNHHWTQQQKKWEREKPVLFTSLNASKLDMSYSTTSTRTNFAAYSHYILLFVLNYFHARAQIHQYVFLLCQISEYMVYILVEFPIFFFVAFRFPFSCTLNYFLRN